MILDTDVIYSSLAEDFNLPEDMLTEYLSHVGMTSIKSHNRYTKAYFQALSRYWNLVKIKDDFERHFVPDTKVDTVGDYINAIKFNNSKSVSTQAEFTQSNIAKEISALNFLNDISLDLGDSSVHYYSLLSLIDQAKSFVITFQDFIFTCSTRLDIINTTDPTGVSIQTHITAFNKFYKDIKLADIRSNLGVFSSKREDCPIAQQLAINVVKSRANVWRQRVLLEMRNCIRDGWFVVFDSLTLDDRCLKAFAEDENALRDYFRNIGRQCNLAMGDKLKAPFSDKYRYFCVPEYGTENGRLHWHVVHLLKVLPKGCTDPNAHAFRTGRPCINTEISWFKRQFKYGNTRPVAVRFLGDSYSHKLGWINPVDKKTNKTVDKGHWVRVAFYVTKYVTKKQDLDVKRHSSNKDTTWYKILATFNKTDFRIRATRGFGTTLPSMSHLSDQTLVELIQVDPKITPLRSLVKKNAVKELSTRICNKFSVAQIQVTAPAPIDLVSLLRDMQSLAPHLEASDIGCILTKIIPLEATSDAVFTYLRDSALLRCDFSDKVRF